MGWVRVRVWVGVSVVRVRVRVTLTLTLTLTHAKSWRVAGARGVARAADEPERCAAVLGGDLATLEQARPLVTPPPRMAFPTYPPSPPSSSSPSSSVGRRSCPGPLPRPPTAPADANYLMACDFRHITPDHKPASETREAAARACETVTSPACTCVQCGTGAHVCAARERVTHIYGTFPGRMPIALLYSCFNYIFSKK